MSQSGSAPYGKHKQKLEIGFFKFPEVVALFKFWKVAIDNCSSDTFIVLIHGADISEILKTMRICEFRIKVKEIKVSFGVGCKTQVEGSVPTIYALTREEKLIRKCPVDRRIGEVLKGVLNKLKYTNLPSMYDKLAKH